MIFFSLSLTPTVLHARQELFDDLFDVSFPDERHGWACGRWGTVLHTSDGGKSWVRQDSGTDFTLISIHFVDPKNGWAVGDGATIIHTADGGKTWEKQKSPQIIVESGMRWDYTTLTSDGQKSSIDLPFMGVHFATARKGWIVAERTHILYTEDGGNTWQIQFSEEDFILKGVSFCDGHNGWAVGEYGYIYHTNDGGKTWEHQAGEFDFSEETGEIIGGNFLFDVVAIDPQTAWVVGIDGYVAKTIDAGVSWQSMTEGFPNTHLFGIASDREGSIIIGGRGTLLSSSNRGKTFQVPRVEPPIKYGWLYGIAPRGTEGFVAVGSSGWIYLSDWKATSWQSVVNP